MRKPVSLFDILLECRVGGEEERRLTICSLRENELFRCHICIFQFGSIGGECNVALDSTIEVVVLSKTTRYEKMRKMKRC